MSRVFAFLCLCLMASSVSTYDTVYFPELAPQLNGYAANARQMRPPRNGNNNRRPNMQQFMNNNGMRPPSMSQQFSSGLQRPSSSGGSRDVCANINPLNAVRPPPRTPAPSNVRKTKDDVNFALPTRQDFHNQFSNIDFFFDVANKEAASQAGGRVQGVSVTDLPALFGQRVSLNLFTIEPCGINLPHTHPRATEMLFLIDGDRFQVGFVEENGGRLIVNEISSGMTTFFPQGQLHFSQNLDCRPARSLSVLNHEDPGVLVASTSLFDIPSLALDTTLNIDPELAQRIRNGLPTLLPGGRAECLSRCGLSPAAQANMSGNV